MVAEMVAARAIAFVLLPSMALAFQPTGAMLGSSVRLGNLGGRCFVSPRDRMIQHFGRTRGLNAGLGIGEEKAQDIGIKMPLDLVEQRLEADRILNIATEEGKLNLKEVELLQQQEGQALQDKLDQEIAKAMKGAEAELLEDYDKATQAILEKMRSERDIIREEAANILKLKDEMDGGGLWWNKRGGDTPKKSSFALTLATFLAWTFAFAGLNELWQAQNTEAGITTLVGGKAAFDMIIAGVSALIATKRSKAT